MMREGERALLHGHVDLGGAVVLAHVLTPRRGAERLDEAGRARATSS